MKKSFLIILFASIIFLFVTQLALAAYKTESNTVTTKVGNPTENTDEGKIAPDGIHACPVAAKYIPFPPGSYSAIGKGEYSYVCGHCRPIYNANDIGIFPEGGTAVVAVVDGKVDNITNPRGGPALWLVGDDKRNYYYAHLRKEGLISGRVKAGQVIGYISGSKESAVSMNNGVAHVHFSAGTPGNEHTFEDPANIPAGPLIDQWCGNNVCNGKPNAAYACGQ